MDLQLTDKAEEILEHLWIKGREEDEPVPHSILPDQEMASLRGAGLVELKGEVVELTEPGLEQARHCVRRHRLAERLLADVLDGAEEQIHAAGCKFEHGLHRGLEQKVCTILGHPRRCPHDKPIPPGECCRRMEREPARLIVPLAEAEPGQRLVIAYLQSMESADLRKLMALGALPGASVTVEQTFPSYLLRASESRFAIDRELAEKVYVRTATS